MGPGLVSPRYESHRFAWLKPMSASTSLSSTYHQVVSASVSWPNALPYISVAKTRLLRPLRSPRLCWEFWIALSCTRPMTRFHWPAAPAAEQDQSTHPSVSAGDAPNWSWIGTVPAGQATPLSQYDWVTAPAPASSTRESRTGRRIMALTTAPRAGGGLPA